MSRRRFNLFMAAMPCVVMACYSFFLPGLSVTQIAILCVIGLSLGYTYGRYA